MDEQYIRYVGIDWATDSHQVCTIDVEHRILDERAVEHSGVGIAQFVDWLSKQVDGDVEHVAVAIETPRGAIVETLIERGFDVYAINPKQLDRFRDRHTVAGAKDDRRDAFVLADSLRTDQHCFRQVRIDDPAIIELREVARVDDDLREEMNRLSNRLREQLHRFFPQMLHNCPAANEPWLWSLLEMIPSPEAVTRIQAQQVTKLLRSHRIRRGAAHELLEKLQEPALRVAAGTVEAATTHIQLLLPRLRLVHQQRAFCKHRLEALLEQVGQAPSGEAPDQKREHRDVDIVLSLPGVGNVVCATVFAEAALPLKERDYHAFRALAGIAPVTRQTGKQGKSGTGRRVTVLMRRACNSRLRNAVYHWSRVSAQRDEASKQHYGALRKRGHTHGRALRGVADRNFRIMFAMLRNGTLYAPDFKTKTAAMPNGEADNLALPAAA